MRQSYTDYFSEHIHRIDRNNNMGLVRYILAFGVLIAHFNYLCGADVPWIISSYNRVGGFFALSGFVLIGSLLKGMPFKEFAIKRAWRILPSYFFVVVAAAVFFVLISDYSITDYYSSTHFWKYLAANLSFLNFLHPALPGVFEGAQHTANAVNGALWTMKVEWQLSLSAPIFVWLCLKYRLNLRKSILIVLGLSLLYRIFLEYKFETTQNPIYEILGRQFFGQVLFFYGGIFIYTFYDRFVEKRNLFIITSCFIYFFTWFVVDDIPGYYLYIQPFVITLLVLSLSMIPGDAAAIIDKGHNISYEIFLCHYPVVQLVAHFRLVEKTGVAGALAIAITMTVLMAIVTYYCVGRLYILRKDRKSQRLSSPVAEK